MSDNPFTDGQQFSSARLNSMYNAHQNNGVLTGLDGTVGTNSFEVDVSAGDVFLNGSVVSTTATTVTHSTSDTEDRIDLITVDATGTVSITTGSPAATSGQPVAPDIPTDEVLAVLVYVRGGSTEILTGDILNDYKTQLELVSQSFIQSINHDFLSNVQSDQHHAPPTETNNTGGTAYYSTGFSTTLNVSDVVTVDPDVAASTIRIQFGAITSTGTDLTVEGQTKVNIESNEFGSLVFRPGGDAAADIRIEFDSLDTQGYVEIDDVEVLVGIGGHSHTI